MSAGRFEHTCQHINMAGRIDAPAKCELRRVICYFSSRKFWKTINAAVSCQTLRQLQRAIMTSGVVLTRGNVLPHSAVATQQLLEQFK
ncbi:hypothetical protein AVEN_114438-1 [Araneus ventricosus]|uniref:Uncharacterized protein n=1 Tax=Araneus ventricosus TaxID=182803 RepID=A0A4Y2IHG1_ARAVE|nr:hypothetical protein AVEN_114438-1 [Araneus ventricosus]